jgi:hypothetical protein
MLLCVVRWYNFSLMSCSISSLFLVVGVRGLVPLGGIFGFFLFFLCREEYCYQ